MALLAVAAIASLGACDSGGSGAAPPPDLRVRRALIGPEGGSLGFESGPHQGVSLVVPPGALATPTEFAIEAAVANPSVLSIIPVYRFTPREVDFVSPATVTVRLGEALLGAGAVCFQQVLPAEDWRVAADSTVDPVAGLVRTPVSELGEFVSWNGALHRLLTQRAGLIDPAVPTRIESIAGVPVTVGNGSLEAQIGRGSLASFWSSPASDNVVIVPGMLGSPLDFLGVQDLVESLAPTFANIVVYGYPSGRGVAFNANALFDEIAAARQPGFGCSIIGHSMGGLVARYLIEQSADDDARPGWREQDEPLDDTIAKLVLMGVPNAGSELGEELVRVLLPNLTLGDQRLLQSAIDLSYRPDAATVAMNAAYVDNATRYHVIYGDLGGGSDGVVSVASALALPLFATESAFLFAAQHDELHTRAASNGVAARLDQLLQAP